MSNLNPTTGASVITDRTSLLSASVSATAATKFHDNLRRVADSLPLSVWLIATIELCKKIRLLWYCQANAELHPKFSKRFFAPWCNRYAPILEWSYDGLA
ncbi:hypothetical protein BDW72DRAFT_177273 [Aspergillus terricola var. indicus]